ncbi:MAG: SpoIID/LytB domain-containing protein [Candidatus Omnitrophota bacterium]
MEPKITRLLTIFCFVFILATGYLRAAPEPTYASKAVRVAILQDKKEFKLAIHGKFSIHDDKDHQTLFEDRLLRKANVKVTEYGFLIGDMPYSQRKIRIISAKDATIDIDGRRYRGEIDILRDSNNRLLVINIVGLEDYVKGVLYHEVSHHWLLEALKAQAVAARTYALYRMELSKNKSYDLTSDIYSQVYGGKNSERFRTNLAVDKTQGLILTFKGKILPAYYSATCAGATEDAAELWKENLPPLKGVVCDYCKNSPHYFWVKNFRLKDIQDKLNARGYELGLIETITILERNESGRIKTLEIKTRDGKVMNISGKDFRNIVGPNAIKSNNYAIEMKGYYMDLVGKGWGHGVGLCQWGAHFMSQARFTYEQILKYYYPGAEIVSYEAKGF